MFPHPGRLRPQGRVHATLHKYLYLWISLLCKWMNILNSTCKMDRYSACHLHSRSEPTAAEIWFTSIPHIASQKAQTHRIDRLSAMIGANKHLLKWARLKTAPLSKWKFQQGSFQSVRSKEARDVQTSWRICQRLWIRCWISSLLLLRLWDWETIVLATLQCSGRVQCLSDFMTL